MTDFIRFAYSLAAADLDGRPGVPLEDSDAIAAALAAPDPAWVHLDADAPETADWMDRHLDYLPMPVRAALLEPETRPRALVHGDGVLVILRGVNLNPGADPEDMVSVRMWVADGRVISLSKRPLASLNELALEVASGDGPQRSGALLARLIELLNQKIDDHLSSLGDEGDKLEAEVLEGPAAPLRARVTGIRGELVDLRRVLIPQRDAVYQLSRDPVEVLDTHDRLHLAESLDRLVRAVEEVESLRDRLVVVKDELASSLSDRLNRNLYLLSVISAVFLPLGVLTGLMGINLAGMPGANWPPAFWVFTGMLGVILMIQVAILRALRFF